MESPEEMIGNDLAMFRLTVTRDKSVWVEKAISLILDDLEGKRFNRERAEQRMRFAIDHELLSGWGYTSKFTFTPSRDAYARELVHEVFGDIEDERPARRGFFAYVLGK